MGGVPSSVALRGTYFTFTRSWNNRGEPLFLLCVRRLYNSDQVFSSAQEIVMGIVLFASWLTIYGSTRSSIIEMSAATGLGARHSTRTTTAAVQRYLCHKKKHQNTAVL